MAADSEDVGLLSGSIVRRSTRQTRAVAFLLCILCCLSAGSVQLFSIYTPALQFKQGYNQLQINAISVSLGLAMYLPVPILGYLGDKHGQAFIGALGGLTLVPGYSAAAYFYHIGASYKLLAMCWALIGCGTSCLFFCGLVTCARIYPHVTGLAISAPVAAFGMSSLWQTQVIRWLFGSEKDVDVEAVFKFFALLYVAGSTCGVAAAKLAKVEVKDKLPQEDEHSDDPSALTQKDRLFKFLSNSESWLFFLVFVVTIGPLEMYLMDMGAIITTIPDGPDVASQVALFSFASTAARLIMGALSDLMRSRVSRPAQLASAFFVTAVCHFLLANGVLSRDGGHLFFVSSIINGFSYGVTFTIVPTVVAGVWGLESFGTNWGIFILAPAIGSTMFNMLFAALYEHASRDSLGAVVEICTRESDCYRWTFLLTGSGMLLASIVTLGLWNVRWKSKIEGL